jgi:hypothetical protein
MSKAEKIITEARNYGVQIVQVGQSLSFAGSYRGSVSVEKSLQRKMERYNQQGGK